MLPSQSTGGAELNRPCHPRPVHVPYPLLLSALAALVALPPAPVTAQAASPRWHELYRPLDDPAAQRMLQHGMQRARELLGEPRIPVRRVHLRHSTPLDPARGLRSGFRLAELVSARDGEFAIYLSRTPGEYAFEGQLAHEIAHLLNAELFDVYAEGLGTVFAERLLRERGGDWTGWERHFREGGDPLYAHSYYMMREVWEVAGDAAMRRLLSFARRPSSGSRMHLDFRAWLATLPPPKRERVRQIVARHAPAIEAEVRHVGEPLSFLRP